MAFKLYKHGPLNQSRIKKMLSENRDHATQMGPWDKFKDYFRSTSKLIRLEQLWHELHVRPCSVKKTPAVRTFITFAKIKELVDEEQQAQFTVLLKYNKFENTSNLTLLINDNTIIRSAPLSPLEHKLISHFIYPDGQIKNGVNEEAMHQLIIDESKQFKKSEDTPQPQELQQQKLSTLFPFEQEIKKIRELAKLAKQAQISSMTNLARFAKQNGIVRVNDLAMFTRQLAIISERELAKFARHAGLNSVTDLALFAHQSWITVIYELASFAKYAEISSVSDLAMFAKLSEINSEFDLASFAKLSGIQFAADLALFANLNQLKTFDQLITFCEHLKIRSLEEIMVFIEQTETLQNSNFSPLELLEFITCVPEPYSTTKYFMLAQQFNSLNKYALAGGLYLKANLFLKAAIAFDKAKLYKGAMFCAVAGGDLVFAEWMQSKIATTPIKHTQQDKLLAIKIYEQANLKQLLAEIYAATKTEDGYDKAIKLYQELALHEQVLEIATRLKGSKNQSLSKC